MKRSLSLMLVLVMFLGTFLCVPVSASEQESAELRFTLNSDGESYSVSGIENIYNGNVIIPSTYLDKPVKSINDYAFSEEFKNSWESRISSVYIPDSVVSIGEYAFNMCSELVTVTGGNNVEVIGEYAFNECEKLESFVISDKVTTVPKYLFNFCKGLQSVTIGDNVTYIDEYAFSMCYSLNEIIFGSSLERIGLYAFRSCESITSLVIPDGVKTIDDLAFVGCDSLAYVEIPASVETIGKCFNYCKGLQTINVNEENTNYSSVDGVLFNKNKDTLIQYPVGKTDIEYIIPDSVITIGYCGFYDNDNLVSVVIPDSVTSIGETAFYSCENLQMNTVPDSVTSIGDAAFGQCYSLTSFVIPNSVENLGDLMFQDCYNLVSAKLPDDITLIPFSMFSGCKALVDYKIPDSVESIDRYAFSQCSSLKTVIIPDSVKTIGFNAFAFCDELQSVEIGDSVEIIDQFAFSFNNKLTTLKIGESVTTIKDNAFYGCNNLENVTYAGSKDSWKNIVIGSGNEVIKNHVIPELPSKPVTPKASTTNEINGIKITWNAVEYAVKYNVYRRQAGSSAWTLVGTTTTTSITDTKVSSGVFYCYSVRAYNSLNQYSDYVAAKTQTRKFMAVPKLTGISNATKGLYIKWNTVNGVTNGYRVYRRGAGQTTWTYLGTTKNTYYTDTAVKNKSGEYYRYTVIADGGYHSKFDTAGLYLKRLANPTLNSAVSSKSGITVKWGKVSGTTGYYVYRKTANSNWVRIAAVGGTNKTTYLDKTAKKGTTYTYTVRAVYGSTTSYFNSGISCKDVY